MIRKIDCVMIKVPDPDRVAAFYEVTFGFKRICRDENSVGLGFKDDESDTEIVVHKLSDIPEKIDINFLVDSVTEALEQFRKMHCKIIAGPFDIPIGKAVVFEDPFGIVWTVLDQSKGKRLPNGMVIPHSNN